MDYDRSRRPSRCELYHRDCPQIATVLSVVLVLVCCLQLDLPCFCRASSVTSTNMRLAPAYTLNGYFQYFGTRRVHFRLWPTCARADVCKRWVVVIVTVVSEIDIFRFFTLGAALSLTGERDPVAPFRRAWMAPGGTHLRPPFLKQTSSLPHRVISISTLWSR